MATRIEKGVQRLCRDLGLPPEGPFTQDWTYELTGKYKSQEYLKKYLLAYARPDYEDVEKQLLMELMLDTCNDLIENGELRDDDWECVVSVLENDIAIHQELVEYWALLEGEWDDVFCLTPRVRELHNRLLGGGNTSG